MKIRELLQGSNARLLFGDLNDEVDFTFFAKDSRLVKPGDVFIGIKGEHFDGNDYFEEAFSRGAKTCILSREVNLNKEYIDKNLILVDDIEEYLVSLAKPIRQKLSIPIIAVTGSVGKTSTKNIIARVLSAKYKVLKTDGNLNTLIGLALTLLRYKDEEIAVIEMGMNHFGEISRLSNFIKPDVAVITNIGTSHIGNLGSRENILKAKLEILEGLNGPVIINHDNDLLFRFHQLNKQRNIISYGIDTPSDYQVEDISYHQSGCDFVINQEKVHINVFGKHFIYNSLVAYLIGDMYQVKHSDILEKLKEIPLEPNRMEVIHKNNITIINDSYNAIYDSVYYALEVLSSFLGRKIAVLGDITELGDYTEEIHRKIGGLILKMGIDILITIGDASSYIHDEAIKCGFDKKNSYHFKSKDEAVKFINQEKRDGDNILLKASNSMKFGEMVQSIK